ncbi:MAG TPA: type II secretion system protein [Planctomycetota bacterium]|nr:type II secretion system protein [Planctomycetota bacterium]
MNRSPKRARLSGFTLIELIVVLGILSIFVAMVLPKLDGLQSNANHAVGAASANDLGRYIQIYKATKNRLPDGYDSLIDPDTDDLWAPFNPGTTPPTPGLHTALSGATHKLVKTTLAAGEVAALNSAGIYTLYDLSPGTVRPGDRFNTPVVIAVDTPVATLDPVNGKKIINHIYRDNLKLDADGNAIPGNDGKIPTGKRLIAFGFGPHNAMVGKTMVETPAYPNVDPTLTYNRNIVIFEVGTTGRAVIKAVVGTDGDLLDDMATDLFKDVQ